MKGMPLSELVPNTYFDRPVYLDKGFILLTRLAGHAGPGQETAEMEVRGGLLRRVAQGLPRLHVRRGDVERRAPAIDEDIRANRQTASARTFYSEFSAFTASLFAKYVSDGVMNLGEVTDWVKKAMQVVHDNRDSLLRFVDMSAEGDRYLISHAVNTTILSIAIGDYLKAPPHRLIELGNACLLHEIGCSSSRPSCAAPRSPSTTTSARCLPRIR